VQAAQDAQAALAANPAPASSAETAQNATALTGVSNPEPVTVAAPEANEPSVEIRTGGPAGPEIVGPVVTPVAPGAVSSLPEVHVLAPLSTVTPLPPMASVSRIVTNNGAIIALEQDDESAT